MAGEHEKYLYSILAFGGFAKGLAWMRFGFSGNGMVYLRFTMMIRWGRF